MFREKRCVGFFARNLRLFNLPPPVLHGVYPGVSILLHNEHDAASARDRRPVISGGALDTTQQCWPALPRHEVSRSGCWGSCCFVVVVFVFVFYCFFPVAHDGYGCGSQMEVTTQQLVGATLRVFIMRRTGVLQSDTVVGYADVAVGDLFSFDSARKPFHTAVDVDGILCTAPFAVCVCVCGGGGGGGGWGGGGGAGWRARVCVCVCVGVVAYGKGHGMRSGP
mgnify:CR=1 FL=1